jgi:Ser/Thr protein kinase RdoA (MazF antagonist)
MPVGPVAGVVTVLKSSPDDERSVLARGLKQRAEVLTPIGSPIHYDFETDNVFYDAATGSCSAIDFDAAMYHWYVMDIAQALVSLKREIPAGQFPHKQAAFTGGYRSRYAIDSTLFAALPLFTRFGNLYRYTGITRAIQDRWEHEPEWLAALRTKLDSVRLRDAAHFGKALEAAP